MGQPTEIKPTHLSLLALERRTNRPLARMPFYAEVAVTTIEAGQEPPIDLDARFDTPITRAVTQLDDECRDNAECSQQVFVALSDVLTRLFDAETRNRLYEDSEQTQELITDIISRALNIANAPTLNDLDENTLKRIFRQAVRQAAEANNLPLVNPPAEDHPIEWAHPLGVLATDHVGYLSFDLTRLPAEVYNSVVTALKARRRDPNAPTEASIWLYPLLRSDLRLDALAQNRFAHDAILVKLELDPQNLPDLLKNMGLLAMQNPSLTDWRLSPASFASNPGALIGEDGCETLLPANVALQEFFFYQVVRLNNVDPGIPPNLRDQVKVGLVHEYRLAWYALGHSLGQILYSLPLAPGESVNLAVIDWTHRDDAQRKEQTKLDEQLVHNEHRDRTITETVNAAVKEYQHGSSFMGGVAGSVGLGAAVSSSVGLAAGLAGSLGGSTSSSDGSRELAATTVQKLSDNITQASASMRELQSTVVVHSVQTEKEAIETRTVVNYNHSHALTILYYEVLRHFRVLTELVRFRPAVLVKVKTDWFTGPEAEKNIRENRAALEAALLDPKYTEAFNALERVARRKLLAAPPPNPGSANKTALKYFTFHMSTGGFFAKGGGEDVDVGAALLKTDGNRIKLMNRAPEPPVLILDQRGSFGEADKVTSFVAMTEDGKTVDWSSIDGVIFDINPTQTNVSFARITIVARDTHGADVMLLDRDYKLGHLIVTGRVQIMLPLDLPPAAPAPPPRPAEEIEDDANVTELLAHLEYHSAHYSRAILLKQNAADRASALDAIKFPDGSSVLDRLENRPLELIGEYLAYPCTDPEWAAAIRQAVQPNQRIHLAAISIDERLITLPTRGVFAEAKLGHCNASEEIDNTRFWDWQQSPIPHLAPEIAPVTPVTPQPQQQNLTPTPFPQSLVNIVNPPNAPDPTGLAAALNVLATPNIFRDMSGRQEVTDLLKRLSDNTIGIAEAANRAREIQAKYGSPSSSTGSVGSGSGFGSRATPIQPSAATRDLQDLRKELGQGVASQMTSPEKARSIYETAADRMTKGPLLGFALDGGEAGGQTSSSLDPGNFKEFVDSNHLDIEIADVLRKLDIYPADSWAKQTATFAYHELKQGNLLAIVKHTNLQKVKALIPSGYSNAADEAQRQVASEGFDTPRLDGITVYDIGGPHAYKGYILMREDQVLKATRPGQPRMFLAVILAHELTHFRNREFFRSFDLQVPLSNAVFVNMNQVVAHQPAAVFAAADFMQELVCRHVEWRVQRDIMIFNQLPGVAPATEDPKGFFKFALKLARRLYAHNDYMEQLSEHQFNQQIGMWIHTIAQTPNVPEPNKEAIMFHDDPAKTTAIKQLFENTFNAVSPDFAEPNVPMWGQGIDD